jgi:hypothetical protein
MEFIIRKLNLFNKTRFTFMQNRHPIPFFGSNIISGTSYRTLYLLFILLFLFIYKPDAIATAHVWIEPDQPEIQYTGRIDFTNKKSPRLFWPGSYIKATFSGSSIQIILDDEKGESYYQVIIDGDEDHAAIIDCKPGMHFYPVITDLNAGNHELLVFRRTEASTGPTDFRGLILDANASILPAPARPQRKIEFYGNSITCGMGNEAHPDSTDGNMAEENNYMTYSAITARNLNAEYTCIAKSGIGILVSWFEMIMPNYYYRLDPDDPESKWDFDQSQPDVVVINLFQNDSWLFDKRLDPIPGKDDIVSAYIRFVSTIRKKYPQAFILCSLGTMDAIAPGKPWPGYIEKSVEILKNMGDQNVEAFIFTYQEFDKHPRVEHHIKMADELTQYLKQRMKW